MSRERRRGARFHAEFWIAIPGVTDSAERVRGNISITGIYFATTRELGELGQVRSLTVSSIDRAHEVGLMAQLVRVVACDDIWRGKSVAGAAFEFLFENEPQREALQQLVLGLTTHHEPTPSAVHVDCQFDAEVGQGDGGEHPAMVSDLGVDRMVINTDWPASVGEALDVGIQAPASRRTFQVRGEVTAVTELGTHEGRIRYRVEVACAGVVASTVGRAEGGSIFEAVEALLDEITDWRQQPPCGATRPDLRGSLQHVRVASLLCFFDAERMSGRLRLGRDEQSTTILISQGHVLDARRDNDDRPPLDLIREVLGWTHGRFDFSVAEVEAEDRIDLPTATLLLETEWRETE